MQIANGHSYLLQGEVILFSLLLVVHYPLMTSWSTEVNDQSGMRRRAFIHPIINHYDHLYWEIVLILWYLLICVHNWYRTWFYINPYILNLILQHHILFALRGEIDLNSLDYIRFKFCDINKIISGIINDDSLTFLANNLKSTMLLQIYVYYYSF